MTLYHWSNWLYTGLGIYVGTYLQPAMDTLRRLHQTFQQQNCVNTVLPESIEPYVPHQVINTLEMMKFIGQQLWIQAEQKLCQTCVKSPEGVYHIHCVIEQKRYSILLKPERGPPAQYTFKDEKERDCSERVNAYLRGKSALQKVTPQILGYKKLIKGVFDEKDIVLSVYEEKEAL